MCRVIDLVPSIESLWHCCWFLFAPESATERIDLPLGSAGDRRSLPLLNKTSTHEPTELPASHDPLDPHQPSTHLRLQPPLAPLPHRTIPWRSPWTPVLARESGPPTRKHARTGR